MLNILRELLGTFLVFAIPYLFFVLAYGAGFMGE